MTIHLLLALGKYLCAPVELRGHLLPALRQFVELLAGALLVEGVPALEGAEGDEGDDHGREEPDRDRLYQQPEQVIVRDAVDGRHGEADSCNKPATRGNGRSARHPGSTP
ncbi:hypothetical protein ACQPXT_13845 [Streptomyces sp. CA-100214]